MKPAAPILFFLCAWLASAGPAAADEVRVGYVDMRRVMTESEVGREAKREIEATIKQREESLRRDEQHLKDLQQDYEKNKLLLSDEQRQAKEREFQQEVREFQQARAEAQREIQGREQEFARRMIPVVREIIGDIAEQRNLALVFEKNEMPVLYAVDGPDLTDDVIRRVNARPEGAKESSTR